MSTSFVNQATSLGLDTFLRLWAETILAIVFAFALLVAAFLIGSKEGMGSIVGGVMGTLAAILGAINSLFLVSLTFGIVSGSVNFGLSAQLGISTELLLLVTIVVLVVGMPLVLVGSFQHLRDRSESV
jgi:hypothetical protein